MPSKKNVVFDLDGPPTAQNRIHAVFAGPSGSMKTYAASSFPKPYFFDFDRGLKTIRDVPWDFDFDEYDENIGRVMLKLQEFERHCPYETFIFDSTTLLAQDVLLYYCKLNGNLDDRGQPTSKVGRLEYGQRVKWLQGFVADIGRFPVNVILICHETTYVVVYTVNRDGTPDKTGPMVTRPAVPGRNLPDQLPVFFDENYHFDVHNGEVSVHTTSDGLFSAKTRLGLPPVIKFKWGDSFYQKIVENLKLKPKARREVGK